MRMIRRAIAALAVGTFALALAASGVSAKTADDWETADIMKKVNGKKGSIPKAAAAVKEGKWDVAAKETENLKHAKDIIKNKPNKGDQEVWEKLTKAYAENVGAMVLAIEKKDKDGFEKTVKAVTGSCKTCHDGHK